jgi:hypothetical protein
MQIADGETIHDSSEIDGPFRVLGSRSRIG